MSEVRGGSSLRIMILILVISNLAQPGLSKLFDVHWGKAFHIHLLNQMSSNSSPLMVHVKSRDNDIGKHALWVNGDFQFHFKVNFWETTLFYSTFRYGNRYARIDLFHIYDCLKPRKTVYWKVKDDGFYHSCDGQNYEKKYNW
ncbi:hypothetical protein PTKIN_Ptkin09bG0212900 [Pterospermum kingtungense]